MAKTPPPKKPKSKASAAVTALPNLKPRKVKRSGYQSFRLQKPIKSDGPVLTGSFRLFGGAVTVLWKNWKVFLGIIIVFAILNLMLVKGFNSGLDINHLRSSVENALQPDTSKAVSSTALYTSLIGNASNAQGSSAAVFQFFLGIIVSLAIVWTLRQVYAGARVRVRDSFYKGMYPLVPFILVLLVITVQLLPLGIGAFLYNALTSVSATGPEVLLWAFLFFLLAVLSMYFLSASLFALYIVCLADMTPLRALRSARELVRYRRWTVLRKVLFLPVALFVCGAIIMIPIIMAIDAFTIWAFFGYSVVCVAVAHSYMYRLYRELL